MKPNHFEAFITEMLNAGEPPEKISKRIVESLEHRDKVCQLCELSPRFEAYMEKLNRGEFDNDNAD